MPSIIPHFWRNAGSQNRQLTSLTKPWQTSSSTNFHGPCHKDAAAAVDAEEERQLAAAEAAEAAEATSEAAGIDGAAGAAAQQAAVVAASERLEQLHAALTKAAAELQATRAALQEEQEKQNVKSRRGYLLRHAIPFPTSGRMKADEAVAAADAAGLTLVLGQSRHGERYERGQRHAC